MLDPFPIPLPAEIVEGHDVILVPNTPLYGPPTAMGTHWQFLEAISPDSMPLVEVFSTHGNSEYFDCPRHLLWQTDGHAVLDALRKGFRLGMIGSSDFHEVLTGHLLRIQDPPRSMNNQHLQGRGGLAALRADELTRTAIFGSMQRRRSFATSGIRAYLDFRVNDHEMGSEFALSTPAEERRLVVAAAPEHITKLEIVRNSDVIADLATGDWFVEAEIFDNDPIPDGAFYYVRITTERADFAWSSPVWTDVQQ